MTPTQLDAARFNETIGIASKMLKRTSDYHEPEPDTTRFDVTIGMADVDAYAFLYYANYIKYGERAAGLAAGQLLVLLEVETMSFVTPVRWGVDVSIYTFLAPGGADESKVRLIHGWVVGASTGEKPVIYNACVATYAVPAGVSTLQSSLREPHRSHPLYHQLMACVRENRTPRPAFALPCAPLAPSRQCHVRTRVYPDAIGHRGRLQPSVAMDMFERHRTAIIGGQPALASLQARTSRAAPQPRSPAAPQPRSPAAP